MGSDEYVGLIRATLDIFHTPVSIYIDRPDPTIASSTPNDIAVYYSVREKGRVFAKTGTDVGNVEGSAYGYLSWRNLLGGAETLNITGSLGTRTRSAYSVSFSTPVRSDPDVRWEIGALINTLRKDWASHEEVSRGWASKVRWLSGWANHHEIGYSGLWRQNTGLAEHASPGVRADAGDSVKSSLTHVWTSDRRDNATLPTKGYLVKTVNEVAGWGPLRGDVAFWKSELESQVAVPIPVPGVRKDGVTFTAGLRGGLLYPLTLAGQPPRQRQHSRINDRFQLGGPTDVRGFRIAGLGPRDGNDALGGDMYYAGSANLFFPLPRLGPDRPIRLQAFINGGRLVALSTDGGPSTTTTHDRSGSGSGAGAGEDRKGLEGEGAVGAGGSIGGQQRSLIRDTANQLFDGLPSTAAGIGLVYAHPVARFELNFSLPLVLRRGEQGRKGLSFGVGISFL